MKRALFLTQLANVHASTRVRLTAFLPLLRLWERTASLELQMTMRMMSVTMTARLDPVTISNTVAVSLRITHISSPTAKVWYRVAVVKMVCFIPSTSVAASLLRNNRVYF